MKPTALILLLFVLNVQMHGQTTNYDTLRKNELSASFLPILVLFSGYDPVGRYGFYNFGYKRYFKSKCVFRASVSFAPNWTFRREYQTYLRTQDTINIFSSSQEGIWQRFQLNLGFEKIFRLKRFMHSYGAEFFFRHQVYSYRNPVFWYPTNLDPNSREAHLTYSPEKGFPNVIYNGIDSLYYSYDMNDLGLGIQLIYTLRYRINKYFYLSSSMGPYLMALRFSYSNQRGDKERFRSGAHTRFDAHILLVSDLSLAFRF